MRKTFSIFLTIILIVIFEVIREAHPIISGMDFFLRFFALSVTAIISCYVFYKYSNISQLIQQGN